MVDGELTAAARVTALEFYSGIGGLHYGLLHAAPHAQVLDAFDLSDVANATYEHNFGIKPAQVNIGALSVAKLSSYGASTWLMSPPCQPYTRKGLKKDSADGRARSFLDILDLLPKLSRPPKFILIENVVGFEASDTRERLLATLSDARYVVQEFILSPLQFGIPYSRPRYFCIAKQAPLAFVSPRDPATNPPRTSVPTSLLPGCSCRGGGDDPYSPGPDTRPLAGFLVEDPAEEWGGAEPMLQHPPDAEDLVGSRYASEAQRDDDNNGGEVGEDPWAAYRVPGHVVELSGFVLDVVSPRATRLKCFTKTYSRYAKGTGSVLATEGSDRLLAYRADNGGVARQGDGGVKEGEGGRVGVASGWGEGNYGEAEFGVSLKDLGLRYFTPREVANLHSFPPSFAFPSHVTLRQRYALLGNSLSVAVVADLLRYLFAEG